MLRPLVELHLVLAGRGTGAARFIDRTIARNNLVTLLFDLHHYLAAAKAFERFGKGRGHPAQLNFGDCMTYAVAKTHGVPFLYKGTGFAFTDIRPALN